mgnify:CR=1 FL=1|tara:strand:- start:660 stop:863 length:204 start_codon:yes stop_codon:yes gene_type:complete
MSDKILSRILLFVFFGILGFIFAPVFSGTTLIHDDFDIAIPEQRSLLQGPGTTEFRAQDTGETCKDY